jgi:acetylornithine deacetylase
VASGLTDDDLLARLVGHDSTSRRSNRPVADFVCDYLDRPACVIERHESADGEKVEVVARVGPEPGPDRGGLVLSGHLDVVPADEPEWESDPFVLREADGRWYGRGTCDMKGFVALAVNRLAALEPDGLAAPLVLVLTSDEELGSLGAQRLAATRPADPPLPVAAVIGEPTSLRVVRMHKGHLTFRITARGRSAHSGSPHLGRNAIEPAARVVTALGALREERARVRADTSVCFPEVPFPVLNVARVSGGTANNVVPERCVVHVGVRLLPGMDTAEPIRRVRDLVAEAAGEDEVAVEVLNDNPPMLLDEGAAINRTLCRLVGQTQTHGVSYASDAGVLRRDLGMECVLYGPGTIEVAHRPNEHVPIDEVRTAGATLDELVNGACRSA